MADHPFNDLDGKVQKFDDLVGEVVGVDKTIVPSGVGRVVLAARIQNFTIDKAKLKKAHRDFLADELGPLLKRNSRFICKIVGVASNDKAGAAYNQQKGRQRAGEVHGFLSVVQSIDGKQLKIQEKGDVRGIFGVQDDQNRAVDVFVFEPLSQQFSIRLISALDVWRRLGLPPTNNMDQVAFLVTDRVNATSAVHLFAEDRPKEMEKVVIIPHDVNDTSGEVLVSLTTPASPVDFAGALVFLFAPDATPGETKSLESRFSNIRINEITPRLPVQGVAWPIGLKSTTGRLVRAQQGQTPTAPRQRPSVPVRLSGRAAVAQR